MSVSSLPVPLYFVPLSIARCVSDRSASVTERIGKGWCFVFAVNSTHVPSKRFANVNLYENFNIFLKVLLSVNRNDSLNFIFIYIGHYMLH